MHDAVPSHRPHKAFAAAVAMIITLVLWVAAAPVGSATTNGSNDSSVTPNGSNGVNHNDEPPAANPDCTDTSGTSGTCDETQPPSNADQNNAGANDTSSSNNYTSTRDGAPSDNGGDNGNATGQPCAGCVGRADNKNPSGQAPSGPIDHNNGYECDGNNGIGQTNPAHTGCQGGVAASTTTTSSCVDTGSGSGSCAENGTHHSEFGSSACVDTMVATCSKGSNAMSASDVVASGGFAGLSAFTARTTGTELPAEVLGATITRGPSTPAATPSVSGATLARTGVELRALQAASVLLLLAGAALVLRARRRVATAPPPIS